MNGATVLTEANLIPLLGFSQLSSTPTRPSPYPRPFGALDAATGFVVAPPVASPLTYFQ
jgi:hypothetical protein